MGERIKRVMASVFEIDVLKIDNSASTKTIDNWDSLRHINLIFALEEEFGIEFDDDETLMLSSYQRIKQAIEEKS